MNFIGHLQTIFKEFGEKPAITDPLGPGQRKSVTYRELDQLSNSFAAFLRSHGCGPGDLTGIFMIRSISQVAAILAAMKLGALPFTLQPKFTARQLGYILSRFPGTILLIDNPGLIKLSLYESNDFNTKHIVLLVESSLSDLQAERVERLSRQCSVDVFPLDRSTRPSITSPLTSETNRGDNDPAFMLFTSGSTGEPKGVQLSQLDLFRRVMSEVQAYRLSHHDRLLNLLPFSFDVGFNQLCSCLAAGAELAILNSWLAHDICKVITDHEITGISCVPSIWSEFMATVPADLIEPLNRVRYITVSGGNLPEQQLRRLRGMFPKSDIYKTYGQTETFRSAMLFPGEFDSKINSVGKPVEGTRVYLLTQDGRMARPNEPGEILHQGMGTMIGYAGDLEASRQKLRPNPFSANPDNEEPVVYTGDIGIMDDDGYLYILGRNDSMCKIHGNRFYPQEIEFCLMNHESIHQAVVIREQTDTGDDRLILLLQFHAGAVLSQDQLRLYLTQRLPSYMVPELVYRVNSFPTTASGKIDKAALQTDYRMYAVEY